MKRIKAGDLNVWAVGGSDRDGGGEGPAIVLCHGFGAPGDDLVSLARVTDVGRDVRWFFPEALLDMPAGMGGGRMWWPIDIERLMGVASRDGGIETLRREVPEGLPKARAALESALDALETSHSVRRDRTIIGGFSQGSMLATEIALHAQARPFAGLAVLSGTLLSEERWRAAAERSGPGIHAIITHGRRDPILPFAFAELLRDMLVGAGANVEFVAHNGAHEIPPQALGALQTLAKTRLGA